jgi:hypothetical protein
MNGDNNTDWMFSRSKLDPSYSGMDRGYNSRTGTLAPTPLNSVVNAASRIGGNQSPTSPSGTDWAKTFGSNSASVAAASSTKNPQSSSFSFSLSPSSDASKLSLDSTKTNATDFYRSRLANSDLTSRDKQLYGAGNDFGFTTY